VDHCSRRSDSTSTLLLAWGKQWTRAIFSRRSGLDACENGVISSYVQLVCALDFVNIMDKRGLICMTVYFPGSFGVECLKLKYDESESRNDDGTRGNL